MSVRGRRPGFHMSANRFYVYAIHDGDGYPVYVGKGCGRRLNTQMSRFGRPGYILRRFRSERDAFRFEGRLIDELAPKLNRCRGGAGGRVTTRVHRRPSWLIEMERVGTRVYAARALLKFDLSAHVSAERLERIRQVAAIG